jgi:Cytochrome c oxidase biogenesis protein Cmc1 like
MVWPFSSSKPPASTAESSQDGLDKSVLVLRQPQTVESKESRERRRRLLTDAIRENCAFEIAAFMECQKSWSLWNRGTLCQASQVKFTDCMNAQRVCDSFEAKC